MKKEFILARNPFLKINCMEILVINYGKLYDCMLAYALLSNALIMFFKKIAYNKL